MASNRISLIRGTSESFEIDLVDDDGQPLPLDKLTGAVATFDMKNAPTDPTSLLHYVSPDAVHLVLDPANSKVTLSFVPADTSAMSLKVYVYQVAVTLSDSTYFAAIPWEPFDLNLGGVAEPPQPAFDNTVQLDHNWNLPDSLKYVSQGGTPIGDAQVRVYYKSDYDAGKLNQPVGITQTDAFGRWKNPVLVLPGYTYTVQFFLPNQFGPDAVEVIV